MRKTLLLWIAWIGVVSAMAAYLTYRFRGTDRSVFLPGPTTHGHYQIEMSCHTCHTPNMGVKEDSCIQCHGAELKAANDSHPKSKFTDPRNADRLAMLDAANCLTCHREHMPARTRAMGVTLPDDYCYHCHQETVRDRPSHQNYAFDSCATAGCHNYHDNRALYEDFLIRHLGQPKTKDAAKVTQRELMAYLIESGRREEKPALTAAQHNAPADVKPSAEVVHAWASTAHAKAAVNCQDCHTVEDPATKTKRWSDKLTHTACATCHKEETNGFLAGKHGMRLAVNLPPMKPAFARLPMKKEAAHRELSCVSCHGAHEFNTRSAAVESCLQCHDDQHSIAYKDSAHYELWQAELSGQGQPGTGVSCATCHLPREVTSRDETRRVIVQHNQNDNLRPNEKMIRTACLNCHGLAFSIDALADAALVRTNFIGRPTRHVESMDLAERRQMEAQKRNQNP
ncbi:MAG: cytochrome c3 family protein [Verrucomicrobiota bacterium]